ncbi:hypothetical protein [Salinibacter ruber]|uniref:CRISPR/Cas system CMR-associated protein Cmr1 (Group 7 of RAMP superfamily) n=1 Tax=Salinibacter ruber TaxID=146919 RepID=A0A9X2U203_9BACT|nr:hypothetical protein [Salinibacter ruber]MCS3864674.1 CRISPR/Cas system CMR-associated protein Cmr1 (group 7 of RAMP superfamily) [Salinibacter ruber]
MRGLGFQVRNTGKYKKEYRLYATAQWSEGGVQQQKIRSISIRGIPRAARRIAKVLVSCHPSHEDKDVQEMTEICWEALEETIMQIHRQDQYPTDKGLDTDRRLQAVHDFVKESPLLSSE